MRDPLDWAFSNEPTAFVQGLFGFGHPGPFRALSLLGDTWGMIFVVGLGAWWFGRTTMYSLIGVVSLGALTKLLLTNLFDVQRPSGPDIVVYDGLEIGAFPSGHVFEAVGPWGQLYALGAVPLWAPVLVALLVGVGRMYLGAHYLADVVAGMVFGAIFVWAYARFWPALRRWIRERPRAFHVALAVIATGGTLWMMMVVGGNPRRFEIYGMVLGAVVGLTLEDRYLRDRRPARPPDGGWGVRAGKVALGAAGIAACLLWDRSGSDQALLLGTFTAGIATVWAVLIAPALFLALGMERGRRVA